MRQVGVLEAKTHLSSLLEAVERGGEEIVITRHGRPVARLSSVPGSERVRRRNGPELAASSKALSEEMARRNPELARITWEELKEMMHK